MKALLMNEEGIPLVNPVTRISQRLPKPLPRNLQDDQVTRLFAVITDRRDRAMFMLMLRCGLRVQEVADLTVDAVEYARRRILVSNGKGAKGRVGQPHLLILCLKRYSPTLLLFWV